MTSDTSPPGSNGEQVRIIREWADFEAIAGDWEALHASARGSLFSSFEWLAAQSAAFAQEGELHVVSIWRNGRLVAAAPLRRVRRQFTKHLPIYNPETFVYFSCGYTGFFDLLAEDHAAGQKLIETVANSARGHVVDLETMPRSAITDALCNKLQERGFRLTRAERFESVIIDGESSYDSYIASRKSSFRKSIRKADRALKDQDAKFELLDARDPTVVSRCFKVSQKSWKDKAGVGIAARNDHRSFVARITSPESAPTTAAAGIISLPAGDIAFALFLIRNGVAHGLWTEFDEAFQETSPGKMAILLTVKELMSHRSIQRFDFVRRTHFTYPFNDDVYGVDRILAYPRVGIANVLQSGLDLSRKMIGIRGKGRRKSVRRKDVVDRDSEESDNSVT